MNSLERILATVSFQNPDRVPVIGQVFGHAAALAGVPLQKYLRDGKILADCQLIALEYYGYDAVFALMDVYVEAETLGTTLSYPEVQYPLVHSYALEQDPKLEESRLPDPSVSGRMPQLLQAATILRENVGDEVLVVGCVVGPMTLATQLMGIENALLTATDNPGYFAELLKFCKDVIVQYGIAQIEAGVHLPVVFDPSASGTLIPPQFFREFELPLLEDIFTTFRRAGAVANWLHITGMTQPIIQYYPQCGATIVNLDYCIDLTKAQETLPGICINGNIKPLFFAQDTPQTIVKESEALLELFKNRGGFILSPGCEVPIESKPKNITALVSVVR